LYSSPNIIRTSKSRRIKWAGYVEGMKANWNTYRVLLGEPEGKKQLEIPKLRFDDNIEMNP
jgi:hypothetical protein